MWQPACEVDGIGEGDVNWTSVQGSFLMIHKPVACEALVVPLGQVYWGWNKGGKEEDFGIHIGTFGQESTARHDVGG